MPMMCLEEQLREAHDWTTPASAVLPEVSAIGQTYPPSLAVGMSWSEFLSLVEKVSMGKVVAVVLDVVDNLHFQSTLISPMRSST